MKKFPQQEFNNILKSLDLKDITLEKIEAKKDIAYVSEKLPIKISDRSKSRQEPGILFIDHYINFTVKAKDLEKPAVEIKAIFRLEFMVKNKIEIPDDFIKIFTSGSIRIITWPYFRELIQNTILRMGLPPLTLPMMINK